MKKEKIDGFAFPARISKMGNNRIVWIPKALHKMIKQFEGKDIVVELRNEDIRY